jgi:putative ABC transport system permease protein
MPAIFAIARSELRRRWRALVVLGLLGGLAGGVVAGSLAVGRRTSTAFDRLVAVTAPGDAVVSVFGNPKVGAAIPDLPPVESSATASMSVFQIETDEVAYVGLMAYADADDPPIRPVVMDGRSVDPTASDEVVVAENFVERAGVGVGSDIPARFLTPEEFGQFDTGFGTPDGPAVSLHVVGIVRWAGPSDDFAPVLAGPAFDAKYGAEVTVGNVYAVELQGGPASAGELEGDLQTISADAGVAPGREEIASVDVRVPTDERESLLPTIRTLVGGLLVFAAAAAVVGLLVLVQGFARLQALGSGDQLVESSLGFTTPQRVSARIVAAGLAMAVAAVVAGFGAFLAGRFEPMGAIESFEPSPGFAPNLTIMAVAAAVAALLVALAAALSAWRSGAPVAGSEPARPSAVADRLAVAGGSPPVVAGIRLALERGRGRATVPVRSALVGAAVGVLGVGAAMVFAGSLDRLVDQPERWGGVADFTVSDVNDDVIAEMSADPRLTDVTDSFDATVVVDGTAVSGYSFQAEKGEVVGWTVLDGRLPTASDDITVGTRLARRLDAGVGDTVRVGTGERTETFEVVGIGIGGYTNNEQLGAAVVLTPESIRRVGATETFREAFAVVDDAEDSDAVASGYANRYEVSTRRPPVEIQSLDELGSLPELFALFAASVGLLAIGNGLFVAVRRRGRDLGVMRTMGFTPRQTAGTVFTMAETSAFVAAAIGIPVGVAVGGAVWSAVASRAYVATDPNVPVAQMFLLGLATLVAVGVFAVIPARRAARVRPADALRAE